MAAFLPEEGIANLKVVAFLLIMAAWFLGLGYLVSRIDDEGFSEPLKLLVFAAGWLAFLIVPYVIFS